MSGSRRSSKTQKRHKADAESEEAQKRQKGDNQEDSEPAEEELDEQVSAFGEALVTMKPEDLSSPSWGSEAPVLAQKWTGPDLTPELFAGNRRYFANISPASLVHKVQEVKWTGRDPFHTTSVTHDKAPLRFLLPCFVGIKPLVGHGNFATTYPWQDKLPKYAPKNPLKANAEVMFNTQRVHDHSGLESDFTQDKHLRAFEDWITEVVESQIQLTRQNLQTLLPGAYKELMTQVLNERVMRAPEDIRKLMDDEKSKKVKLTTEQQQTLKEFRQVSESDVLERFDVCRDSYIGYPWFTHPDGGKWFTLKAPLWRPMNANERAQWADNRDAHAKKMSLLELTAGNFGFARNVFKLVDIRGGELNQFSTSIKTGDVFSAMVELTTRADNTKNKVYIKLTMLFLRFCYAGSPMERKEDAIESALEEDLEYEAKLCQMSPELQRLLMPPTGRNPQWNAHPVVSLALMKDGDTQGSTEAAALMDSWSRTYKDEDAASGASGQLVAT
jgi:hypothetical protein